MIISIYIYDLYNIVENCAARKIWFLNDFNNKMRIARIFIYEENIKRIEIVHLNHAKLGFSFKNIKFKKNRNVKC